MDSQYPTCAILADRHAILAERVRDLLETAFQTVFLVADSQTLMEGASRLLPSLIVMDLALANGNCGELLKEISAMSPGSRLLVLTVHDEAMVARHAMRSGAHGVVLKRCIGHDFMPAVDALLQGEEYVSPDIGLALATH